MSRITPSLFTRTSFLFLAFFCIAVPRVRADVNLHGLFSENMVLQAGEKDPIWGTADPQEKITVTLDGERATAIADSSGHWRVELGPLKPGGPFDMTVEGKNKIIVHDVLVGQVWLCSGQSNMAFTVGPQLKWWETGVEDYKNVIASAGYPMIRMFNVDRAVAGKPQSEVKGKWELASPETVANFSAVGYFFALNLFESLHEPIGVIHSSWGGTPAESWTPLETLQANAAFSDVLEKWRKEDQAYPDQFEHYKESLAKWNEATKQAEAAGKPMPPAPELPRDPRSEPKRPGALYDGMIAPLIPYRIKGVIWYQGESNAHRGIEYRTLFPALIRDWRKAWGEGDFPFLYVQLSSYQNVHPPANWPLLREAQLMALSVSKTAMAVTIDIGSTDMVHPRNKQEVGRRLALAARAIAYDQNVFYSGPLYSSMEVEGNKIRLHFTNLGGGLVSGSDLGTPRRLEGFEIAGADQQFFGADAQIRGDTVVVKSERVAHPVAVRYGWQSYPICNLFNQAGLPASPFRTDNWPQQEAHGGDSENDVP